MKTLKEKRGKEEQRAVEEFHKEQMERSKLRERIRKNEKLAKKLEREK